MLRTRKFNKNLPTCHYPVDVGKTEGGVYFADLAINNVIVFMQCACNCSYLTKCCLFRHAGDQIEYTEFDTVRLEASTCDKLSGT